MKKRALSILLALCMCLALPVVAWADGGASSESGHLHCLCGAQHQTIGDHSKAQTAFTEWTSTTSLPEDSGNYYLSGDVAISETWEPGDGTVLCLNGHTITMTGDKDVIGIGDNCNFTLTDCASTQGKITHKSGKTGCGVNNKGTFKMYGGIICGNEADSYGGGVYMKDATFNMYGGTIKDNEAVSAGGGVYINAGSVMKMVGGEIKGNTAGYNGGGVCVKGIMSVGGKVNITTNKIKLGDVTQESNVYVDVNATMALNGTELDYESRIGLNTDVISGTLVENVNNIDGDVSACFSSDYTRYVLQVNGDGHLEIAPREHYIALGGNLVITDDYESADKTIKYDKAANTLTLSNASINGASMVHAGAVAGMVVGNDELTINLIGANTITVPKAENVATVEGIYADELKLTGSGSLTISTGNAARYNYGIGVRTLDVQDGVTLTVSTGTSGYMTQGIYASQKVNIGAATVSVTAGKATCMSEGIYAKQQIDIADNAVVTATAGATTGDDETNVTYSRGIVVKSESSVDSQLNIGKATVTAIGGASNGCYYAYSYGICADKMNVADGAVVTATGGTATASGDTKVTYSTGLAYSYGIEINSGITVNAAEVTATGGNATGWKTAYSFGIQCTGIDINDGAKLNAAGGNVTATGERSPYPGNAYSCALAAYSLDIAKAEVTATGGNATVLNQNVGFYKDEYAEPDEEQYTYYYSNVESVGVNVNDVKLAAGGKLTTKAGIATNRSGSKSAGYVDAYSTGMYVYCHDDEDAAAINGTLVAIGGKAFGSTGVFTHEGDDESSTVSKVLGGDVGSMGVCVYGRLLIGSGANVQMSGAYAECSGNAGGWAYSNGCIVNGQFVMNDGSVYVSGGKAKGGKVTDVDALCVWTDYDIDGEFEIDGGWLKLVSDEVAIRAEESLVSNVDLLTPENGQRVKMAAGDNYENGYQTIVENTDDGEKVAAVVLFHDGLADELTPVAVDTSSGSSGGSGGHKKNDTTKEDEKKDELKDETKTDEQTGTGEFTDVKDSDYFSGAVDWASKKGITGGTTPNTFGPHESCTRGQLVTFLWRVAEKPAAEHELTFTDVKPGMYYKEAVTWAAMLEIVKGYSDSEFAPDDNITREQMAAVLYRFAKAMGMDTTQGGMAVREFADWEQVSDYAKAAVQWAVNAGIMQGDNGYLLPQDECTRAQIVTMLHRLLGK